MLRPPTTPKKNIPAALLIFFLASASGAQRPASTSSGRPATGAGGVEIVQNSGYPELHVDGKPFFIHAATFFYYRIPRDLWEASLDRHRELGINTMDLVIPWNWHEPHEGELDFDGHSNPRRDLRSLLRMIAEKRFKLIARPGPVVGADWRHGGYPDWLLARPEYGMSAEARNAGRYPPLAELAAGHPEAAAAEWLANPTHMEYTKKWLASVAGELLPYRPQQTLHIQVPGEKEGRTETLEISGPLLFVQLGESRGADGSGAGRANARRYVEALREMLTAGGLHVPLAVHAAETGSRADARSDIGEVGEWYLRPVSIPGLATSGPRTLRALDVSQMEAAVERLKSQTALPPILIGYQAGWMTPAGDGRPMESDPANTLLSSRLLIGYGARGLNYFPLQDTLTPAGYEVPWANAHYRWDAALDLSGNQRPRARPVLLNGRLLEASGELLAATHRRADFGVVVMPAGTAKENRAAAMAAMKLGRLAHLAGLAAEWVDPERQPVERLLHHPLVVLPPLGAPQRVALSEKAQRALVEYVRRGGVLAVAPPLPRGTILEELWKPAGSQNIWIVGEGRVIALEQDFFSWVELEETYPQARMRGEFFAATQTLRGLLDQALARPAVRRDVNHTGSGEMVVTQLVSNIGTGLLGARNGGRGILSVTNLSDEPGEETIEILSPRSGARSTGGGYVTLSLQVPPRESLLLPLHHPLCATAQPRDNCRDEVITSGAELLKAERDGKTLQLTLHVLSRATVLLRLGKQPGRVSLDEFRPEAVWNPEEQELRVVVPRGAWPSFERVLKIRLPYAPHLPEAPKKPPRGRRDFDSWVVDAVRLPLGDDASLLSYPPLVILDSERNGQMLVETKNYDELGRGVDFAVEGPVRGSDGVGLSAGETRQVPLELRNNGTTAAGNGLAEPAADGLLRGELEVKSGRDRRRSPLLFAVVPKEGAAAYRLDFDRDGVEEWVLESASLRLIVAPMSGGRALALVNKETPINVLTSVGGMIEQITLADQSAGFLRLAYTAEWLKEEKLTALRLRTASSAGEITKTVRLKDKETVEVEYQIKSAMPIAAVNSLPAVAGDERGTRFCWKREAGPAASGTEQATEPGCETFTPGRGRVELLEQARRLEVRTPGRMALALEWDGGRMSIDMKNDSALLRLRFAAAPAGLVSRQTLRYKILPLN